MNGVLTRGLAFGLGILISAGSIGFAMEKESAAWPEGVPLTTKELSGEAVLRTVGDAEPDGEVVTFDLWFRCDANWGYAFNPYLDRSLPAPVHFAVFNDRRQKVCDFRLDADQPDTVVIESAWRMIRPGDLLGTRFQLRTAVPGTEPLTEGPLLKTLECPLPPGRYYVQAIYTRSFLSPKPTRADGSVTPFAVVRWRDLRADPELFRSNAVAVTVTDAGLLQPAAKPVIDSSTGAFLYASQDRVGPGEFLVLEAGYANMSPDTQVVYNPFFNFLAWQRPAKIMVQDAAGGNRGDLLLKLWGSQVSNERQFREPLPSGGIAGAVLRRRINLGPGMYSLQAIYSQHFFLDETDPPAESEPPRSAPVQLQVVDPDDVHPQL